MREGISKEGFDDKIDQELLLDRQHAEKWIQQKDGILGSPLAECSHTTRTVPMKKGQKYSTVDMYGGDGYGEGYISDDNGTIFTL